MDTYHHTQGDKTIMAIAVFLGSLFFALLTVFCAVSWTATIIRSLRRDRLGMLRKSDVALPTVRGMNTTICLLLTPATYAFLYGIANIPLDVTLGKSILIGTLVLFVYCGVLWLITLYLRFRPKQPIYVYHLPGDADKVRLRACAYGIMLAA